MKNHNIQHNTIFGYGLVAKALIKQFSNYNFTIYDDHITQTQQLENAILKPMNAFDPKASNLEIISASIAPDHIITSTAKQLISEYDFIYDRFTVPFSIWISGTNGKTTTTEMLQSLLESKGACLGGNIGVPLCQMDLNAKLWILETSSFVLHYNKIAKPNIYALLPVAQDHINWHKNFTSYAKAKLKPLATMQEGELAIIPRSLVALIPETSAFVIYYENSQDLAKQFCLDLSQIKLQEPFLLDATMAMAVYQSLYFQQPYEKINQFKTANHRLEAIQDSRGRLWINDSKATNVHASQEAIKAYAKRKVHLILGGDDKGMDLQPLFDLLKPLKHFKLYAIGSNKDRLKQLAKKNNLHLVTCINLNDAVTRIKVILNDDEAVLLSPAAASLDEFSSYQVRGDLFKSLIN